MGAKPQQRLTIFQSRMARAGLRWRIEDLANAAEVSDRTVNRFENGEATPVPSTLKALRQALEEAGAEFLDDDGVRIKNDAVTDQMRNAMTMNK